MTEYVIPAFMGMIGGVLSWFATNFLGYLLTRFYKLKDEILSSLRLYANVSPVYERDNPREHPDWDRFVEAQGTFRRQASELQALAANHPFIGRILARLGYRLVDAASGLIGFSNTLADPTARRSGEFARHRDAVERSLKFPLSYPAGIKLRDE